MLDDESQWQTIYNGFHTRLDEKTPLGEIAIPGFFTQHIIRTYCISQQADPKWWLAGRLNHLLGIATPDFLASQWQIPLDRKILLKLPPETPEYRLKFKPVKWLKEVALVIEIYTGE